MSVSDRTEALRKALPSLGLARRFELIDELGIYHHPETISGEGSTLAETAALRRALPGLIREYGIASVLDLPCGDFNWLRHVPLDGLDYVGGDIVPRIVERNRRLYSSAGRRFEVMNAAEDALPQVDLIICRDLLIHLGLADISRVLHRFAESGSVWLLVTHFSGTSENVDIESGDFRPVNLCAAPFHLPAPIRVVPEESAMAGGRYGDRAMALWRIPDVEPGRPGERDVRSWRCAPGPRRRIRSPGR